MDKHLIRLSFELISLRHNRIYGSLFFQFSEEKNFSNFKRHLKNPNLPSNNSKPSPSNRQKYQGPIFFLLSRNGPKLIQRILQRKSTHNRSF